LTPYQLYPISVSCWSYHHSDRVNDSLTIPIVLSVVGVIVVTISGWLGGELVFKHGVAVDSQRGAPAEEI